MPKKCVPKVKDPGPNQKPFEVQAGDNNFKLISTYRVSLVKDKSLAFRKSRLKNTQQSRSIIRQLITELGQPDREQLCVILLNAKNEIIGLNIVATGSLSATTVSAREVLKPAIIANSSAMILCHNHPSGDPEPSLQDHDATRMVVQAAKLVDIQVLDHIIINMEDSRYFSFADTGFIKKAYDEIACGSPCKLTEKIDLKPHKNQKPLGDIENQEVFTSKQIQSVYESIKDWCLNYNTTELPENLSGIEFQISVLSHFYDKVGFPAFRLCAELRSQKNTQEHIRQMKELDNLNDRLRIVVQERVDIMKNLKINKAKEGHA